MTALQARTCVCGRWVQIKKYTSSSESLIDAISQVSIPAKNFDELLKHPLHPSSAILPPECMDLYLKDPPIFGNISFIVQAVTKGGSTEQWSRYGKNEFPLLT